MKVLPKVSLLLGLILCIGLFFRFHRFSEVPYSLYWDEAAILLDAKSLATTGKDMHGNSGWQLIFPSYGDYKLPVYIWLTTVAVKLFGVSAFAARFPSLIAGLCTLLGIWLLAKGLGALQGSQSSEKWAWGSVVVALLSPWAIGFARTGFESHVAQAFLLWSLVVWVHKVLLFPKKTNNALFLLWVGVSAGLGLLAAYTYFALRYVWPVVIMASLLLVPNWKSQWLRLVSAVVVAVVIGYVGFLPMTNSPLYKESTKLRLGTASLLNTDTYVLESNVLREIAGNTPFDRVIFHRYILMGQGLAKNYADHFSWQYLFMTGDPNLRHSTGDFGLFLLPFAVLPFVGLSRVKGKWWRPAAWLVVWWLAAVLPAAVPLNTPHALRSLSGLAPASLLFGGCLALGYQWYLQNNRKLNVLSIATYAWCGWLTLSVFAFGWYYFQVYPKVSAKEWQYGYNELAQAALQNNKSYNHPVVVTGFDDRFFLWQLALLEYKAEAFPSMSHNQYRITSTASDGILFDEVPQMKEWAKTKTAFSVAGTPGQLESWQKSLKVQWDVTHEIKSPNGELLYQVAKTKYEE